MKYSKIALFEKDLKEALPHPLSQVYALLIPEVSEQKFVIERLWQGWGGEKVTTVLDGLGVAISSLDLFTQKRCLISDGIERYKKKDFENLLPSLKKIPSDLIVILVGSALKALPSFYEAMEKEMVLLDLTKESFWERKNRLHKWILEMVHEKGKQLAPDAATHLLDFALLNFALLTQEINKVIAFVGQAKIITLQDVRAVCHFEPAQKRWDLSQALIFGGSVDYPSLHRIDSAALYGFIGQLRYQLKLGLFVATALAKGEEGRIMEAYPKLHLRTLKLYKTQARALTASYFSRGMKLLFELELKARSGLDTTLLLDWFAFKLQRKRHVNSLGVLQKD